MSTEPTISTLEAAERLGVDPLDVYRLIDEGRLAPSWDGHRLVVPVSEIGIPRQLCFLTPECGAAGRQTSRSLFSRAGGIATGYFRLCRRTEAWQPVIFRALCVTESGSAAHGDRG